MRVSLHNTGASIDVDRLNTTSTALVVVPKRENKSETSDYIRLMKPRVMSLSIFSAIVGMLLAPNHIHPVISIVAIISITIGAGAAGAINMWYDHDIDSIMQRTKKRPIAAGKIEPDEALAFGVIMAFFAVFIMAVCVNYLSSILLLVTILFYICIYTIWLKKRTAQNIVIGGFAGALPPLIGWTASTGSISIEPLTLVLIIFLWTPPHFWALALYRAADYEIAGIPMMPVVIGDYYTKIQIVIYTLLTVAASFLPFIVGMCSNIYLVFSLLFGSIFIYYAVSLLKDNKNNNAMKMFFFSILYLFILLASMLLDHYATISSS